VTLFHYQKLRSQTNTNTDLLAQLNDANLYQGALWGAFTGLFGMAGNEIIVVSALDSDQGVKTHPLTEADEIWQPTARPLNADPCTADGLYVFRRFHVREDDVEEVVALSKEAWNTFEGSGAYAAQPRGLFRPQADDDGIVRLMLVTWYDGFQSWEISRRPAPEAAENFRRRRDLTLTTYAVATRLVNPA
jgi:hypothetical protein